MKNKTSSLIKSPRTAGRKKRPEHKKRDSRFSPISSSPKNSGSVLDQEQMLSDFNESGTTRKSTNLG